KAEQPHLLIVKHGLAIFDAAGLDQAKNVMSTVLFNRELRLLDLPDARWSRYRGAGGMAYPHPITLPEQAALLRRKPTAITSKAHWPAGKRIPGTSSSKVYRLGDFEAAWRKHEAAQGHAGPRLRLVTPTSDYAGTPRTPRFARRAGCADGIGDGMAMRRAWRSW